MKSENFHRRQFLRIAGLTVTSAIAGSSLTGCAGIGKSDTAMRRPNIVFVFADQWRAEATGYAGNKQVHTPELDKLAAESVNFTNAVSGCPVCCPYRASLLTGQYPLTHGVFLNDVPLAPDAVSVAKIYRQAGYNTGYIGKWHLDGVSRSAPITLERRQGFDFWRAYGCTHDYNNSFYYNNDNDRLKWQGYDSIVQTDVAIDYIKEYAPTGPFCLFLSWGPPHAPYQTAPQKYRDMFRPEDIILRPNIPKANENAARQALAGYYAHIAALDDCIARLVTAIKDAGIEDNTILVFTSDHGDMLFSHGNQKKQQPWDESILVPFLIRYPALLGRKGRVIDMPINTPDIMPTLLGLSGLPIPGSVEGEDFSSVITGNRKPWNQAALISCPSPFGQWTRKIGGREYRGVRTKRYTYVRDLKGPWLLFDNDKDALQLDNLVNRPEYKKLQQQMEIILTEKLKETGDSFVSGWDYIKKWNYEVDDSGTVVYTN